jgi:hypothetical protein
MRSQLTMVVLLAAIGGAGTYAAEKTRAVVYVSDVYISDRDDSSQLLGPGKVLATGIFGKIGVRLNWRAGELPKARSAAGNESAQRAFGIRTVKHAPESATPGALAAARILGSSGTEIAVYEDRVQLFLDNHRNLAGAAVGYVLAHELAHVMQGVGRHSESGILKAQWSNADFEEMIFHNLAFTNFDVELIHRGLTEGSASGLATGGFPESGGSGSPAGLGAAKR